MQILIFLTVVSALLSLVQVCAMDPGKEAEPAQDFGNQTLSEKNPEEDPGMFEGDINLDEKTENAISGAMQTHDSLSLGPEYRWTNNIMPYVFDTFLSRDGRTAVLQAMNHINLETQGCIKFETRFLQSSYVRFFQGNGCYSRIGRDPNNVAQDISIGQGCETLGIATHEILHALGFFHEQSRLDRDDYVTVHLENVRLGLENNFQKYEFGYGDTLGAPYDYRSLMHYPRLAFSLNGKDTIVPKDENARIGQRVGLSPIDTWQLRKLYNCPGVEPNPPPASTSKPPLGDECVNYKSLSEANRLDSFISTVSTATCDSDLADGWYRFEGSAGSRMPEEPPETYRCGTAAPGWLNGRHPTELNKVVGADVCFRWILYQCEAKQRIFIRNCGGFFVYYLGPVPLCKSRYCGSSESLIKPSESSTTQMPSLELRTKPPSTQAPTSTSKPPLAAECVNYKSLSEANRLDSFISTVSTATCDIDLANGWYRFEGSAGSRMPEEPPETYRCGTAAPGWLNGRHPTELNKVVGADVCFRWMSNQCLAKQRIFIRNCGGYFVYYLGPVPLCNSRYCGSSKSLIKPSEVPTTQMPSLELTTKPPSTQGMLKTFFLGFFLPFLKISV